MSEVELKWERQKDAKTRENENDLNYFLGKKGKAQKFLLNLWFFIVSNALRFVMSFIRRIYDSKRRMKL